MYSAELKDMNIEDSINDLYLEAFELKAESQTSPRMAYPQLHEEPLVDLGSKAAKRIKPAKSQNGDPDEGQSQPLGLRQHHPLEESKHEEAIDSPKHQIVEEL